MIATLILAAVIDPAQVREATKQLDAYCKILKCPRPVVVAVLPPEAIQHHGAITRRLGHSPGCVVNLSIEGVRRPDWLAHEACHCAHDADAMDERGWLASVSGVERTRREDEAKLCEQKLLEKR